MKIAPLERARDLFYQRRFLPAFELFRRYFDRLPFELSDAHVCYIGPFVTCLTCLGKDSLVLFYKLPFDPTPI